MRSLKFIFFVIFTFVLASNALSQQVFHGVVIDVIDGKTAVIKLRTQSKIRAELEYIEIPEPEQQLRQTVKAHLAKLLLGQEIEFVAKSVMPTHLIGRIYLKNVDIGQQMLRDGAAWYAIAEKARQDTTESENYQIVEAQAKLEKRGVWGIENFKPKQDRCTAVPVRKWCGVRQATTPLGKRARADRLWAALREEIPSLGSSQGPPMIHANIGAPV